MATKRNQAIINTFVFILGSILLFSCKKEETPENNTTPNSGFQTVYYSWAGQKFVIFQYDSIINDSTQIQVAANDTMSFISQHNVVCRDTTAYYTHANEHTGSVFRIDPPFPFGGTLMPLTSSPGVSDTFLFHTVNYSVSYLIHSKRIQ